MRYVFLVITTMLYSFMALCQDKIIEVLKEDVEWSEGSIMLGDGTKLKGFLKYNDKNGVLSFQDEGETRAFSSRNVPGFEFWDKVLQMQRVFYTFLFKDPEIDVERPQFFEVIKEFNAFAVLSKADPMGYKEKILPVYPVHDVGVVLNEFGVDFAKNKKVSQTETIYIMDATTGSIKPYMRIVDKDKDGIILDRSKTKNKIMDSDLLEKYTGEFYERLEAFAKEHKLKFKRKNDLMKILDYYSSLLK